MRPFPLQAGALTYTSPDNGPLYNQGNDQIVNTTVTMARLGRPPWLPGGPAAVGSPAGLAAGATPAARRTFAIRKPSCPRFRRVPFLQWPGD